MECTEFPDPYAADGVANMAYRLRSHRYAIASRVLSFRARGRLAPLKIGLDALGTSRLNRNRQFAPR